jgi:hypothetical protein
MGGRRRYTEAMAVSNKSVGTIVILALLLVLLYALNPSTADFQAWRSAQAQGQPASGDASGLKGVMRKASGAIAGAMTGLVAGAYKRTDYLVCSSYALGRDRYLGIARLFIKLK